MEELKTLLDFLQPSQRVDLKTVALTYVQGLTGSDEGKAAIFTLDDMMKAIFELTLDSTAVVAKDAVLCLINLTAEETYAIKTLMLAKQVHPKFDIVAVAVKHIIDEHTELADPWTMVLSNLTRVEKLVPEILNTLEQDEQTLPKLIKAFSQLDYNKKKCKLHYLAPIICNITQIARGREICCHSKYQLLNKLLPFASFEGNVVRRGGSIGIIKNICFDVVYHDIILNDDDDFLVAILKPLSGPEEFSDDENDKLPMELQYLPESKKRETDPDLRKMLLECLLQLCATRRCRELLRSKGTYEILREYHKWEAKVGRCSECLLACENVVDILIKKEHEIGLDNYKNVDVPAEQAEKFVQEDAEYVNNLIE